MDWKAHFQKASENINADNSPFGMDVTHKNIADVKVGIPQASVGADIPEPSGWVTLLLTGAAFSYLMYKNGEEHREMWAAIDQERINRIIMDNALGMDKNKIKMDVDELVHGADTRRASVPYVQRVALPSLPPAFTKRYSVPPTRRAPGSLIPTQRIPVSERKTLRGA